MTDWRPNVGDVVRLKIHKSADIPKGSVGIITDVEVLPHLRDVRFWVRWRRDTLNLDYVHIKHIKPANPTTLSNSTKVWIVKEKMNGL